MADVEETLKRIQSHKGVIGVVIVNKEGRPIRTTLDNSSTIQYIRVTSTLATKAQNVVRDLDPQDEVTFVRMRSKKNEILIMPDKDYTLVVIQNPTATL